MDWLKKNAFALLIFAAVAVAAFFAWKEIKKQMDEKKAEKDADTTGTTAVQSSDSVLSSLPAAEAV